MNKFQWVLPSILAIICLIQCANTKEDCCSQCAEKDGIIIIDTQDTAFVSKAKVVMVAGSQQVFVQGAEKVRVKDMPQGIIILDTQDTARVSLNVRTDKLDRIADHIQHKVRSGVKAEKDGK